MEPGWFWEAFADQTQGAPEIGSVRGGLSVWAAVLQANLPEVGGEFFAGDPFTRPSDPDPQTGRRQCHHPGGSVLGVVSVAGVDFQHGTEATAPPQSMA
jgi:hypothetical protein